MPELPEVETVRAGLEPVLRGRRFVRVEQRRKNLRFPLPDRFAERLTGRKVERLDRRAKYILVHLDGGEVLAVHLGMTGRFSVKLPPVRSGARTPSPRLRGRVRVRGRNRFGGAAAAPHPNPLPTESVGGEGTPTRRLHLRAWARRQARPSRVHDVGRGGGHLQRRAALRLHGARPDRRPQRPCVFRRARSRAAGG